MRVWTVASVSVALSSVVCGCHGSKTTLPSDAGLAFDAGVEIQASSGTGGYQQQVQGTGGAPLSPNDAAVAWPDGDRDAAAPDGDAQGAVPFGLYGAPLIFAPTSRSFGLHCVVVGGSPSRLRVQVRAEGAVNWSAGLAPESPAPDVARWRVEGLDAGTRYEYLVTGAEDTGTVVLFSGQVTTQRSPGEDFSFALITDSHIAPREVPAGDLGTNGSTEETLLGVAADVLTYRPDFLIHLGDMLDFHSFGFNEPPTDGSWTRLGYLDYRRLLSETLGNTAHFAVIGNWEGENGDYTEEEISRSRDQRLLYLPGPRPETYPETGSPNEDYYAFTWGDALFVVLNVMTYTPTRHDLSGTGGTADDWTLGETQLDWLEETLRNATSKWRFLFIHHTVGGAAGDEANSMYGRGGGQAAYVGEQALVHDLMIQYGVQVFFYGHDHVFVDMVVDGIHYTLPGSAGAPWKFTEFETGYTDYWVDSGHARVDVTPDSVLVEFVALGGNVIYSYTLE